MTEQKLVYVPMDTNAQYVEAALNQQAQEGWEFEDTITQITHKGGAIFAQPLGYYFEDTLFVFRKSDRPGEYRCRFLQRKLNANQNIDALNQKIVEQNAEGYEIVKILQLSSISDTEGRPSTGTVGHVLIFHSVAAI